MRILKKHKWHPYKMEMLQHLSEGNPDRPMEFSEWAVNKLDGGTNFSSGILFTDEANFYVNGEVDHQNLRYWSDINSQWMNPSKMQGAGKVMVWCGIWDNKIVRPVFFDTNLIAEMYLNMLQNTVMLSLLNKEGEFLSPPHYVSACAAGWISSSWVPGFVTVVLLSGLKGPQT
jgi:hypothetical protein